MGPRDEDDGRPLGADAAAPASPPSSCRPGCWLALAVASTACQLQRRPADGRDRHPQGARRRGTARGLPAGPPRQPSQSRRGAPDRLSAGGPRATAPRRRAAHEQ